MSVNAEYCTNLKRVDLVLFIDWITVAFHPQISNNILSPLIFNEPLKPILKSLQIHSLLQRFSFRFISVSLQTFCIRSRVDNVNKVISRVTKKMKTSKIKNSERKTILRDFFYTLYITTDFSLKAKVTAQRFQARKNAMLDLFILIAVVKEKKKKKEYV